MTAKSNRILAAVMFSDLEGYTALMHTDELSARQILDRFRLVNQQLHDQFEGQIINFFGDGTLSIFTSTVNAVACAIEIQKQLRDPVKVPLRIGIDVGDIVHEAGNILGDAVNLASRIESFSLPGAVLVSEAVFHQVKNQRHFRFEALGQFQFKNVSNPVLVYALSNEGLLVPDPSKLRGKGYRIDTAGDNFPAVLNSFLGRKKEIRDIIELLADHRLITLSGPGGTGKTRLSIEAARKAKTNFRDGIFWSPLAGIKEIDAVAIAIAKYLKLEEDAIRSTEESLIDFFHDKNALLVLDNFEQITGAASTVELLIQHCPDLSIIVTSRITLQIMGEFEYQVPPLKVPKLSEFNTLLQLAEMPSIALFTQRAILSQRNFQLTPENVTAVAEICVRLDGLPLAIELAAARIKIFSPNALLERLKKSLNVLKGSENYPARHQTLRQTIAWSYDLLDPEEQQLFRRVSLFTGGCTMEAIELICGENTAPNWDILDGVTALVNKSLLVADSTAYEMRFFMLETLREFASEELEKTQEIEKMKNAYIHYYCELSEQAAPNFYGGEAERWDEIIYRELSNIRAAIQYAISMKEMAWGYRIGSALIPFWSFRGMTANEGVQQLEKLAAAPFPESLWVERLKILQNLARFYGYTPFRDKAESIFDECLAYWRKQGDANQIGLVLNDFGWYYIEGAFDYQKADRYSLEAKSIFEQVSNPGRLIASLNNLGMSRMFRSRPLEAIPFFEQTAELTRQMEDNRRNAQAILNTAYCNYLQGNYEQAEQQINISLITFRKNSSKILEEFALIILCFIYYEYGEYEQCKQLSTEVRKIAEETRTSFAIALSILCQASADYGMGNLVEARDLAGKILNIIENISKIKGWHLNMTLALQSNIAWQMRDFNLVKSCAEKLLEDGLEQENYSGFIPGIEMTARVAALDGAYELSAKLYFNAQNLRAKLGIPIRRSEQKIFRDLVSDLNSNLSAQKYTEAKEKHLDNPSMLSIAKRLLEH